VDRQLLALVVRDSPHLRPTRERSAPDVNAHGAAGPRCGRSIQMTKSEGRVLSMRSPLLGRDAILICEVS
jgi:hypothetical protein